MCYEIYASLSTSRASQSHFKSVKYYIFDSYSSFHLHLTSSICCDNYPTFSVFCIYYCYDGLLRERPFEIIGYAFTIFIIFITVVVNFIVEGEEGDIIKLVNLICTVTMPARVILYDTD